MYKDYKVIELDTIIKQANYNQYFHTFDNLNNILLEECKKHLLIIFVRPHNLRSDLIIEDPNQVRLSDIKYTMKIAECASLLILIHNNAAYALKDRYQHAIIPLKTRIKNLNDIKKYEFALHNYFSEFYGEH